MSNEDPTNPQQSGGMPPPPPPYGATQPPAPYGQMGAMPPQGYTPGPPPTRPGALERAVKLMQLGGVLSLLNLVTVFLFRDQIRKAAEEGAADSGTANVDIDTIVAVTITFALIIGLLGALLWFAMAHLNGKGKSWARIVASVFYGISVLSFVFSLSQPQPIVGRLLSVVSLVVGTLAVLHLWKPESSAYYNAVSGNRV
ncbi:hypothetical protein [Nostocoides sp.]|uniref:hypothetical protein n=1 Tax=Nostocoides sp. TaxID=1917966 RepID=UPI002C6146B2|nr:hypothetical protein [Tetrasphaera sp.]